MIHYLLKAGGQIDSGMDILFHGTIPNGAGLSSSASIEMLTGSILKSYSAWMFPILNWRLSEKESKMNLSA